MDYNNLIILRSLSKEFGIPGLRLGYLLTANKEIKNKINEHLPVWNINSIAEWFLESFIKFKDNYEHSIKKIVSDRDSFYSNLNEISYLTPFKPYANFVLCKLNPGVSASKLKNVLFERYNILIKDCSNKKGLEKDRFIRLAVRTSEDNDVLLSALKSFGQENISN